MRFFVGAAFFALFTFGQTVAAAKRRTPFEFRIGPDGAIPIIVGDTALRALLHPQIAPLTVMDQKCGRRLQRCHKYCETMRDYCSQLCKKFRYEEQVSCNDVIPYEGARHDPKNLLMLEVPGLPYGFLAKDRFAFGEVEETSGRRWKRETAKRNLTAENKKLVVFSAIRLDYRLLQRFDATIGLKNDDYSAVREIAALLNQPPLISIAFQPHLPSINRRTTKFKPFIYGTWSDSSYGASIMFGSTQRCQCEKFVWTSEGINNDWTLNGMASHGDKEISKITLLFDPYRFDSLIPKHFFQLESKLNLSRESLEFTQSGKRLFTLPQRWRAQPVPYPFTQPNIWIYGRDFLIEQCIAFDFERRRMGFARRRAKPAFPFFN